MEEHLRFTARLYGVADAESRIPALLAEMDLTEKRSVLPSELSRGMKQKLSVATALLHDPAVLILDEPLTGLDPAGIRRMKDTIRRRAGRGTGLRPNSPPQTTSVSLKRFRCFKSAMNAASGWSISFARSGRRSSMS